MATIVKNEIVRVDGYKTTDDERWKDEEMAMAHQKQLDMRANLRAVVESFYSSSSDYTDSDDIVEGMMQYIPELREIFNNQ